MSDFDKLCGLKIVASPYLDQFTPRETLSEDVVVSSKFRRDFNLWLKTIFGEEMNFYIIRNDGYGMGVVLANEQYIITHPENVARLKLAVNKK